MEKGIVEVLQNEMFDFTAPVIINNLPSIDGLLCSQRQVIWGMKKAGMTSDKQFYKMLKASGRIFDYYVLGDAPLCSVMKNMGNNYILHKYLIPKGSFGNKNSIDGKGAAPRYIECKLDKYAEYMIEGIEKNAVTMKNNYDATEKEPIILPSKIPNILTNLRMSIAVSEANKMPSHNLIDTCNSIEYYIKTKDIEKTIELLKVPDLPSGGTIIYDKKTFDSIYKTGKGSFINLGKYKYDKKTNTIIIYEIPYNTYIENIYDELEKNIDKFSKEIVDYHNGSDKDGLKLILYLKKDANVSTVIQKLRKYTSFESKFACNFTILDLDNKTPKLMNLETIISKWLQHRYNCINNETQFEINKAKIELNKLYGLQIILQDLDKTISLIRKSKSEKIAIKSLIDYFKLNQEQAEYISSSVKLININEEWLNNKINNIKSLEDTLLKLNSNLNNKEYIDSIIIQQLEYCKKTFGQPRKTEIIYEDTIQDIEPEQLIEDYNIHLTLTKDNYFKKTQSTSLRGNTSQKLKDNDSIIAELDSTNKSDILFFTNKCNCYKKHLYEFEDKKLSVLGDYLVNDLQLETDEKIEFMITTTDYKEQLITCFSNGKIAKTPLSSYFVKQNRTKPIKAISNKSKVINMFTIVDETKFICQSSINKVLIINSSFINPKASKTNSGTQVMKSKSNSAMILCEAITNINANNIDTKYYTNNKAGVGKYLRKEDSIERI